MMSKTVSMHFLSLRCQILFVDDGNAPDTRTFEARKGVDFSTSSFGEEGHGYVFSGSLLWQKREVHPFSESQGCHTMGPIEAPNFGSLKLNRQLCLSGRVFF